MKLRDHDQPCEHESIGSHNVLGDSTTGSSQLPIKGWCPGGREITINYKAAAAELVSWARETEGERTSGAAVVDIVNAALGVTE